MSIHLKKTAVRLALGLAVLAALPGVVAAEASQVRILLVIDTSAAGANKIGLSLDRDNIARAMRDALVRQRLDKRCTVTVLQGAKATPQAVLAYYKELKTNPYEALFFYYSGHGAVLPGKGQALTMKEGALLRSQLSQAMQRHRPRLSVILTDCCSNIVGTKPGVKPVRQAPAAADVRGKTPAAKSTAKSYRGSGSVLRDLLFRHRGLVEIGAASTGQFAVGNTKHGGNFTSAFCKLLNASVTSFDTNRDGFVEWREFFAVWQRQTQQQSYANGLTQVPHALSLGQPSEN
jgi:hypothetical protein